MEPEIAEPKVDLHENRNSYDLSVLKSYGCDLLLFADWWYVTTDAYICCSTFFLILVSLT